MTFARLREFLSELPCTCGRPITSHAPGEAVAHERGTRKEHSRTANTPDGVRALSAKVSGTSKTKVV